MSFQLENIIKKKVVSKNLIQNEFDKNDKEIQSKILNLKWFIIDFRYTNFNNRNKSMSQNAHLLSSLLCKIFA